MHILADIGGTRTRIAASVDLETFGEPVIFDTPDRYDQGFSAITEAVKKLAGGSVESMAVGITGIVSKQNGILVKNSHPDWKGHAIGSDLASSLSTSVHFENDAALVGLGEAVYGAGRGADIVVYVTVSTGVNGIRIVDSRIDRAAVGFEIGGQYLIVGGMPQTLEGLVSGSAIHKKYGKHPKELGLESPVWEELAETLAYGLHNTILHWSPDRVVLGGSMFNEIGIKVDRVAYHLQQIMIELPSLPEIVHSELADLGGLYGGLAFLKQKK